MSIRVPLVLAALMLFSTSCAPSHTQIVALQKNAQGCLVMSARNKNLKVRVENSMAKSRMVFRQVVAKRQGNKIISAGLFCTCSP